MKQLLILLIFIMSLSAVEFKYEKKGEYSLDLEDYSITLWKIIYYNNHFYGVDQKLGSIFIFDNKFNLVDRVGRKGSGPGEFQSIGYITISRGKLFVTDGKSKELTIFDLEDNSLLKKIKMDKYDFLKIFSTENHFYTTYSQFEDQYNKLKRYLVQIKHDDLINNNFDNMKELNSFYMKKIGEHFWSSPNRFLISINNNRLLYSISDTDKYQFTTISDNGDIDTTRKRYRALSINDINKKIYKRTFDRFNGKKMAFYKLYGIENYTLVNKERIRDQRNAKTYYMDIFKKDKYLGEITLDFMPNFCDQLSSNTLYFLNGKLYRYDIDNSTITEYSYQIIE